MHYNCYIGFIMIISFLYALFIHNLKNKNFLYWKYKFNVIIEGELIAINYYICGSEQNDLTIEYFYVTSLRHSNKNEIFLDNLTNFNSRRLIRGR